MEINGLKIPDELITLIDSGWWPTKDNEMSQHLKCLVTAESVKKISEDEALIYLIITDLGEAFYIRPEKLKLRGFAAGCHYIGIY
ncbi:MAG: hypothetical protein GY795_30855 [Desulfobacterales bacterium]|nr:hypothetical protein [Desulfobacterales bacterium]